MAIPAPQREAIEGLLDQAARDGVPVDAVMLLPSLYLDTGEQIFLQGVSAGATIRGSKYWNTDVAVYVRRRHRVTRKPVLNEQFCRPGVMVDAAVLQQPNPSGTPSNAMLLELLLPGVVDRCLRFKPRNLGTWFLKIA